MYDVSVISEDFTTYAHTADCAQCTADLNSDVLERLRLLE